MQYKQNKNINIILISLICIGCTTTERWKAPQSDARINRRSKTQIRDFGT